MAEFGRGVFTLLRRPEVELESGYSRSTLYARIQERLFTEPVLIGPRAVAWPAAEVQALNRARIAGATEAEIRKLVVKLEAARKLGGADASAAAEARR